MKKEDLFFYSLTAFIGTAVLGFIITLIKRNTLTLLSNILVILFWILLLIGIVLLIALAKNTKPNKKEIFRSVRFFNNKLMKIVDSILILSITCTVILSVCNINMPLLWSIVVFSDILSIESHFLFNVI
ncbi:hypothetical protein RBG61_13570 [Paludicola sp. MB14-C6]|uniref:hypothetical protein n=1 Tax=Paludihabitans sp. MB14-C6 TaxID=3070656 RepID=UPI0027DC96BE|nr:hypothetical protein [Paludicola sp. MB14-C6]WMJ22998.1 hypothetical protein RBG61_13570 [Paludicola sp. MB14-C6]